MKKIMKLARSSTVPAMTFRLDAYVFIQLQLNSLRSNKLVSLLWMRREGKGAGVRTILLLFRLRTQQRNIEQHTIDTFDNLTFIDILIY